MDFSQLSPANMLAAILLVTMAPFVAVMITSFTKIVVVLGLVRNALGLQQSPPNVVLNGMALILTIYVMYPVGQQMATRLEQIPEPMKNAATMAQSAAIAKEPLRDFLVKFAHPRETAFFLKTAQNTLPPDKAQQLTARDFVVVAPAFTVTELSTAFQIGFLIFLPFLVIDLVVANILMALGMQQLSPPTISLPFKLLLFVLVDGWVKLTHGLVLTYH